MEGVCFELEGAALEDFGEADDTGADDGGGVLELEGLRGVDDIGGGEAVVEPAGAVGVGDVLGDGGGEGDDVVADFGFDLVDAVDGEVAAVTDSVGCGLGDDAGAGEGLRGGDLDGEPAAVLVFVGPDAAHVGARVAGDQAVVPSGAATRSMGRPDSGRIRSVRSERLTPKSWPSRRRGSHGRGGRAGPICRR